MTKGSKFETLCFLDLYSVPVCVEQNLCSFSLNLVTMYGQWVMARKIPSETQRLYLLLCFTCARPWRLKLTRKMYVFCKISVQHYTDSSQASLSSLNPGDRCYYEAQLAVGLGLRVIVIVTHTTLLCVPSCRCTWGPLLSQAKGKWLSWLALWKTESDDSSWRWRLLL